jgi:predicted dinucleotide-binding enzyme
VVKAFNSVFASVQGNPGLHGTTLDALIATDDDAAARTVAGLASSIGFRPVKVGPLAAATELEALAWLNIRMQVLTGGYWQTAFQLVAAPEASLVASPLAAGVA